MSAYRFSWIAKIQFAAHYIDLPEYFSIPNVKLFKYAAVQTENPIMKNYFSLLFLIGIVGLSCSSDSDTTDT
ncbi:MAG: hypothetical protein AAF765_06695, partial [Bacteroidota bacterium]